MPVERSMRRDPVKSSPKRPDRGTSCSIESLRDEIEWLKHAHPTATLERERCLVSRITDSTETPEGLADAFLRPPLDSRAYRKRYGTLYTSVYRPKLGTMELRWPNGEWVQSFEDFREGRWSVQYREENRSVAVGG